jgi:hypothetical protein
VILEHAELDGQRVDFDEKFVYIGLEAIGPRCFGVAGMDINCRCTTIAIVDGVEPSLRRDNETGEITPYKNYKDWESDRAKTAGAGRPNYNPKRGDRPVSIKGTLPNGRTYRPHTAPQDAPDPYKNKLGVDLTKRLSHKELQGLSVDQLDTYMKNIGKPMSNDRLNRMWWKANGKPALVKADRTDYAIDNPMKTLSLPTNKLGQGGKYTYASSHDVLRASEQWRRNADGSWGKPGYNCQTIIYANELNMRGYRVTTANSVVSEKHWCKAYMEKGEAHTANGHRAMVIAGDVIDVPLKYDEYLNRLKPTKKEQLEFLRGLEPGRWAVSEKGHVYSLIKHKNGDMEFLDGQRDDGVLVGIVQAGASMEKWQSKVWLDGVTLATRLDNAWLDKAVAEKMMKGW